MSDFGNASMRLHLQHHGKVEIRSKVPLTTRDDLSLAYTPGVATVCLAVQSDPSLAFTHTFKGNSVAIVSDGSAVLGLGNIGPLAALPVMEGKAILFKEFAGIDGVPVVLNTQDPVKIVETVRAIAPTFGGINLEDIAAPACFWIESQLQDLGIPVFHDDQHGTAIVVLAGLLNACKVTGKKPEDLIVVINGAGAAGTSIAKLLRCVGQSPDQCIPVRDVLACDSKGIISRSRYDSLNEDKRRLLAFTNRKDREGTMEQALEGADVFIGVSVGNLLTGDFIRSMAKDPLIFALANPTPEIMPAEAHAAGAAVVCTGRSDFPNQINNVLAFPGIFRGALDVRAPKITESMKIAAAYALAAAVENPRPDKVIPDTLELGIAKIVAHAVSERWKRDIIE